MEIELVNYFIKGNIELTKVDKDYPDNKLTGAEFEVYADTNGNGELDEGDKLLGEMIELEGRRLSDEGTSLRKIPCP